MNLTNWLSRVYVGCWRKNRTTFALLETSEFGTFETCRCRLMMSVYRVERKSSVRGQTDANDPKADVRLRVRDNSQLHDRRFSA